MRTASLDPKPWLIATQRLERKADPPDPGPKATFAERMARCVATKAGRTHDKLRQQTAEPVFGIIKEALSFGRFSRRGLAKTKTEWALALEIWLNRPAPLEVMRQALDKAARA